MNDQDDQSALHKAAEGGHVEIVKLLLDKGANIEATDRVGHCLCIYILLLVVLSSMSL